MGLYNVIKCFLFIFELYLIYKCLVLVFLICYCFIKIVYRVGIYRDLRVYGLLLKIYGNFRFNLFFVV